MLILLLVSMALLIRTNPNTTASAASSSSPASSSTRKEGGETTGIVDYLLRTCITQANEKDAQITDLKKEIDRLKAEKATEMDNLKKDENESSEPEKEAESQLDTILIMGGKIRGEAFPGMTILNNDRSKWIELQLELPHKTYSSGAVYLNGEIYLIGRHDNPKALYKLDKNLTWIQMADMNVGRYWITNSCVAWNGYIWVLGGMNSDASALKSVERYDPKDDKWTLMQEMNPRSHAAALLWNDSIVISGGFEDSFVKPVSTVQWFSSSDERWSDLPSMPYPRRSHSLVNYKNKLIIMGGIDKSKFPQKTVWKLDPLETNATWTALPSMKYLSESFVGAALDDEIYAIGGQDTLLQGLNRVEIFDGEKWREGPSLPYSAWGMSIVIIPQELAVRLLAHRPV